MNKKLIFSLLLFITAVTAYYFYIPPEVQTSPPSPNNDDPFIFGAIQSYNDQLYNYRNYDSLGLNCMHNYNTQDKNFPGDTNRYTPRSWLSPLDRLYADVSVYDTIVRCAISRLNQNRQSTIIWARPKIEWLAYGQRSDYQCENINPPDSTWFYSFKSNNPSHNYTGETVPDSGAVVKRCLITADDEGYVVDRLKANTEQCRSAYGGTSSINQWMGDSECDWYIEPRIRIDSNDAKDPDNPIVCNIKVIKEDGNTILKDVNIRANNFLDNDGHYNGRYLEEFNFNGDTSLIIKKQSWGEVWWAAGRGNDDYDHSDSKADIQVYWYDQVDMFIDYVRVDNDVAHTLFRGDYDNTWLQWELNLANETPGAVKKFYIEYAEFNNLPCIGYINNYMHLHNSNVDLVTDFHPVLFAHLNGNWTYTMGDPQWLAKYYVKRAGLTAFYAESYPLKSRYETPNNASVSKIPYTLPYLDNGNNPPGDSMLAWPVEPDVYDDWLQDNMFRDYTLAFGDPYDKFSWPINCASNLGQDAGNFGWVMRKGHQISKLADVPFIYMPQAHLWYWPEEVEREPTNEELEMFANVSVSYGAKALMYWWFLGDDWDDQCRKYHRGMMADTNVIRETNVYGQEKDKWKTFRDIGNRLKNNWGPYLMNFDTNRHICVYNDETERPQFENATYFRSVASYRPGSGDPPCYYDMPDVSSRLTDGLIYECPDHNYVQAATFNTIPGSNTQYFMIVNRRCSPYVDSTTEDNRGGRRYIRVWFDSASSYFPNPYNSWKIVELGNDTAAAITFNKHAPNKIALGWFMPGEGRLYKIEPVPVKGGTLVADEVISSDMICEDTVFTNGFNITVENNVDILFTDTSNFVIQGGSFTMGNSLYSGVPNITCGATSGNSWNGFVFDNCEVRIYNSTFSGFGSDTSYALNMIDCPLIDIRNNAFSNSQNSTLGAINVTYYDIDSINNVYIENNTFELTNSVVPAVNILSYAGITTPLIIENNIFSSSTDNSTAILLSGITGGAVKHNTFTNFKTGLNLLSSSIDVSENTLSSNLASAIGILAVSGSEIKMNPSGELQLGGDNNISCTGNGSKNIKVDNSYFNMDYGENVFNIAELNYSYHMNGWFDPFLQVSTNARENCFKVLDQPYAPPIENLKWGENGSDIEFVFSPYLTGCIPEGCETYYIVDLGGGMYDTICVGGGGGDSFLPVETGRGSVASVPNASTQSMHSTKCIILNPKQAYDSLCIYMRLRNYAQAKNKCYELLNNYPDSIQSLNAVNKLFLAVTATDASQNGINQLKIYFETLILNHSGNTALVKRCNYFVQKCKVRMREYSSALTGFQQIISQNPTSYEGLVARWDYMATSLLMHGGGTGGISSIENYELGITNEEEKAYKASEFDEFDKFDESDELGDDRNPFTREEKKAIRNAVNNVLNISRENNDKRIEILKERSDVGDVDAKRELEHINKMKEVVKTQKPKNVIEHIKIINSDIQKIFGGKSSNNKSPQNNIPVVYRLAQNYPNPFNPVTTIKYELPKDSKVKLVVYDLLGREVKVLVNNEIRSAGYYKVEFNMQNYASGVYFYRIEADDTKGNKFIDAKKMVLVK